MFWKKKKKSRLQELEEKVRNHDVIFERMRRELDAVHHRMRNPGSGMRRKVEAPVENDDPQSWLEDPHKTQFIDDTMTRVFVKPLDQWGTEPHDPIPLVNGKAKK